MALRWGCRAVDVRTGEELEQELKTALSAETTTVIVVRTQPRKRCCNSIAATAMSLKQHAT
jgi:benzoylformate decarboxylase